MFGVPLNTLPLVIYIGIFCYWVLLHYNMSFKTIAGGFNGAFWWYGPLSEDRDKFLTNLPKLSCDLNEFLFIILHVYVYTCMWLCVYLYTHVRDFLTKGTFLTTPKIRPRREFSLSPIRKKYPDVTFPGALWDRAVATSFPARKQGWPVKRARTCTCIGLRLSSCDQHNGSLAKTTHWTTDHNYNVQVMWIGNLGMM